MFLDKLIAFFKPKKPKKEPLTELETVAMMFEAFPKTKKVTKKKTPAKKNKPIKRKPSSRSNQERS